MKLKFKQNLLALSALTVLFGLGGTFIQDHQDLSSQYVIKTDGDYH